MAASGEGLAGHHQAVASAAQRLRPNRLSLSDKMLFGSPVLSMIGVTIGPSATALTRIPRPASSAAVVLAKERSFGCRIRAGPCRTCLASNAGIQNDRRAVIQQKQGFLDREVGSFNIDIEILVVGAFRGLGKRRKLRDSRVHE